MQSRPAILFFAAAALVIAACAKRPPAQGPPPDTVTNRVVVETVTVRDPELERRGAVLGLQVLEREAQIQDLERRLDEARQEAVRAMARLQTLATRAEAASGIAEAEIGVQTLRNQAGSASVGELEQAEQLLRMSTTEFDNQNYGGSLYLATQAKNLAKAGETRIAGTPRAALRPGEVPFAIPLSLRVEGAANVREGPGTSFPVLFTLEPGAQFVGHSYLNEWVRISDAQGRTGWVFYNLVSGGGESGP
jgi:hypothetical protein